MDIAAIGTQTATVGTKHELFATTSSSVYMLMVDTSNMANGDKIELVIEIAFKSGGALVQTHYATFAHVQSDKGKTSVPVAAPFGATFYLKQTAGTGRSFDWCITSG